VAAIAVAFFGLIGARPDIGSAIATWRFDYKFLVTLTVAISAFAVLRPALYPQGRPNYWVLLAGPAPARAGGRHRTGQPSGCGLDDVGGGQELV
jgi:hypothetical protein